MTDKAKEQAFERAQERAVVNYYNAWCAGAINLHPDESRLFFDAGYAAALASRPAETPRVDPYICANCGEHQSRPDDHRSGVIPSGFACSPRPADHPAVTPQPKTEPCTCNAQRDGDMQWTHAPNCPRSESWQRRVAKDASAQPKTEAQTPTCLNCNDTGWYAAGNTGHAMRCRCAAKDASAAEPEPPVSDTMRLLAAEALADEVAVLVARRVISERSPAADALLDYRNPPRNQRSDRMAELERRLAAPTVTHTTTPTEPEGGSDRAEYERNHRPAIDIEDIIKHCRLSLDGKSVSLTELRKALKKATGGQR